MKVYSYSEARENLTALLEEAGTAGEVRIQRKDGQMFVVKPVEMTASPLDVAGVPLGVTTDEIVEFVREGRSWGDTEGDGPVDRS